MPKYWNKKRKAINIEGIEILNNDIFEAFNKISHKNGNKSQHAKNNISTNFDPFNIN